MNERTRPFQHPYMAVAGVVCWFALAAHFYVIVTQAVADGMTVGAGVMQYYRQFTVLTNILVAVSFSYPLVSRDSRTGRFFASPEVIGAIAVYIVTTGAGYSLLLRSLHHRVGLRFVTGELLHDVIPIVYVLYWLLFVPKGYLRWKHVVEWFVYPAGYFVYVLVLGAVSGSYPYPFLDVSRHGYATVLRNGGALGIGIVILSVLVVLTDRVMGKRRSANRRAASYA